MGVFIFINWTSDYFLYHHFSHDVSMVHINLTVAL